MTKRSLKMRESGNLFKGSPGPIFSFSFFLLKYGYWITIKQNKYMKLHKQPWVWIIAFSLVLSGAIIYFADEVSLFPEEEVAVVVNDEKMNKGEFNMVLQQAQQNQTEIREISGEEFSEEEAKEMAVEMAVDQLLLISYAKKLNLAVSEKEMEDFYREIIGHEPGIKTKAELFSAWEDEGFNQREMERQVRVYLIYDKMYDYYLERVEATEEDLEESYNEYISWLKEIDAHDDSAMSFEEIKEELREFIVQEKALDLMEVEIESFRDGSSIEVLI